MSVLNTVGFPVWYEDGFGRRCCFYLDENGNMVFEGQDKEKIMRMTRCGIGSDLPEKCAQDDAEHSGS